MSKLKKLMQEFKAFITRGNVVDMAVAVIIGSAFSAIVTALTNKILQPLIDAAVGSGDGIGLKTMLKTVYEYAEDGKILTDESGSYIINWTNSIYIDWGAFIMAIIDFLLIAIVLFVIVKVFMGLQNVRNEITSKENKQIAKQAKKLAKEEGISFKEAYSRIEEETKAKKEAEAKAAADAAAAEEAAKPTTEKLLADIKALLEKQIEISAATEQKDSQKSE